MDALVEALAKLAPPPKPEPSVAPTLACPACTLLGAEDRGAIVVPRTDGTRTEVGRAYGCPHCTAAWFVWDGNVRRFGWHKASLQSHPQAQTFAPPPRAEDERTVPVG